MQSLQIFSRPLNVLDSLGFLLHLGSKLVIAFRDYLSYFIPQPSHLDDVALHQSMSFDLLVLGAAEPSDPPQLLLRVLFHLFLQLLRLKVALMVDPEVLIVFDNLGDLVALESLSLASFEVEHKAVVI